MGFLRRWAAYAKKAAHRSPRYLAFRLYQELASHARRPWSRVRPGLLRASWLVRTNGSHSLSELWEALHHGAFLLDPKRAQEYVAQFRDRWPELPDRVMSQADAIVRHEFNLLGSGPRRLGAHLPWHEDFKSGKEWPLRYAADLDYNDIERNSDVKVPWELSRCQHFAALGQAYWLSGDERYAREFVAEITDWIERNPWYYGINWSCTMDVALRAVSWIWGFFFFANSEACRSGAFRSAFLSSLWLHGEFIEANPEYAEVNGNHYLVDGVGLVFLGGFFRRSRAGRRWLRKGREIVVDEIFKQTTQDGVDFEQSTAYHRLVLEAFLTSYLVLRNVGEDAPAPAWQRVERMCQFVLAYTKPNGESPLVGDADDGRVQVLGLQAVRDHRYLLSTAAVLFRKPAFKGGAGKFWEETLWLLGPQAGPAYDGIQIGDPATSAAFEAGGFMVLRNKDTHLFVDVGEVGMRGLGGHGHNDVLSFELTLGGVDLVSDCGAYLYTADRVARNLFRSTAFHNTIEVDGQELNRFLGDHDLWRLHYDAVPVGVRYSFGPDRDVLVASHTGYHRLPEPVTHQREFFLHKHRNVVVIRDRIVGTGSHRLVWRCHLNPGVRSVIARDHVTLSSPQGRAWFGLYQAPPGFVLGIESGWISESYGVREPTGVLVIRAAGVVPAVFTCLFALDALDERSCGEYVAALDKSSHETAILR